MNVIAGIVIGIIAESWVAVIGYSFYWAFIHVLYGVIFGFHKNPIVESTKAGKPILSYYLARFFTGLLTSAVIACVILFLMQFLTR